jgi:hypothetical protein
MARSNVSAVKPGASTVYPSTSSAVAGGVTWYADYAERLAHVTSYAGGEG